MDQTMDALRIGWKVASNFNKKTGIEYEELASLASEITLKVLPMYNENKSALSSFIWQSVKNGISDYLKKEMRRTEQELQAGWYAEFEEDIHKTIEFMDEVSTWEEEEQEIASILFDPEWSEKLGTEPSTPPKMIRGRLSEYLKKERNWTNKKVTKTFKSMKKKFK